MSRYVHRSQYFYGNKISDYGLENGFVDYRTLAQAFDAVLCNDIIQKTVGYWEPYCGTEYYYEDRNGDRLTCEEYESLSDEEQESCTELYHEVFQWYIITENGAKILEELTNEIVYYNKKLDMYVWGVTHWGTSWDYVLTDIRIELDKEDLC